MLTEVNMTERAFNEETPISSMFCGMWKSRFLSVLVSLGVPGLLCNSCGPVSIQDIAERTGCRTDDKICKLMRTMAQWGTGEELSERSFQANKAMELLRRYKGPSLGYIVSYYGSDEESICHFYREEKFVIVNSCNPEDGGQTTMWLERFTSGFSRYSYHDALQDGKF